MTTRLRALINSLGLSDRAFAIQCGIKQATLDKQLKGLRAISMETLTSILRTYSEVSAEWLMRGEGSMLRTEDTTREVKTIAMLADTIATLQAAINEKDKTIALLKEENQQLKLSLTK